MPGSPSLAVGLGPDVTVNAGQAVPSFLPAAPKMPTLWVELLLLSSQSVFRPPCRRWSFSCG